MAAGTLPPAQRAVLVLRFCHQLSERETAEALGCSPGTAKSRAARAPDRRVPVDDGLTQGYGFRGDARESQSGNASPSGTFTVSNRLHPEVIPDAEDLVLMLRPAKRLHGTEICSGADTNHPCHVGSCRHLRVG